MTSKRRTVPAGHDMRCCESGACEVDRRTFVKLGSASLAALGISGSLRAFAGPFGLQDTADHCIPIDKKLDEQWLQGLFARGDRTWYTGDDLKTIGMPVGGICAGQLYLTGDGRLVYWGIFNRGTNSGYGQINYKVGRAPTEMVEGVTKFAEAPVIDQGCVVRVVSQGKTEIRTLDREGFPQVRFCGEYPIGEVAYAAEGFPLTITLQAFSPFIPLNPDESALPATLLHYTLKNTSDATVEATLAGLLQNGVLHYSRELCAATHVRFGDVKTGDRVTSILLGARPGQAVPPTTREPLVFADFEGGDYGDWKITGEAFGRAPAKGTLDRQQAVSGYRGKGLVNTYLGGDDRLQGTLTSPEFKIERSYISFLVGGGPDNKTAIRLIVDGQIVRSASGQQKELLQPHNWDVRDLQGKTAHIEIVDEVSAAWGHINVDQIELRDTPMARRVEDVRQLTDFGTMALSVLGNGSPLVSVSLPESASLAEVFDGDALASDNCTDKPLDSRLRCAIGRQVEIAPGAETTVTIAVTWHMPNLRFRNEEQQELVRNRYVTRFGNAIDVAQYVARNFERLAAQTRLWHDTYYDSTLPYWLLDRLHSTVGNLATETCQWWENGRFWAWEGCGCCHGTCGHVWNYEHAMARLFPQLERSVREMQDFAPGIGWIPATGEIRFRGEDWEMWAGDAQGGYILKAYREHQLSEDGQFLQRNWPNIRKSIQFLIDQDGNGDGLIEGRQHQTYDQDYYGANTMVGSLYLGALRAAEEMARDVGEVEFADTCRRIFEAGKVNSVKTLFNGEYFVQKVDLAKHPEWQYADGCLADQMFGQGWAHQVELGYVYPKETVLKSLDSIWRYCWAPDIALQNKKHDPERWFAYPGEAGLFTCTWPKSKHLGPKSTRYRDEIWTGIEYQVANHMAYEGMLTESLAICRAVHDRYHPAKHNPFNEIECGDHYARAMASWGVLLGLAGFAYHGPKRHLGFSPRMTPEKFRSVFSTADAWGTYDQRREAKRQTHSIDVKWGILHLRTLAFDLPENAQVGSIMVNGSDIEFEVSREGTKVLIGFAEELAVAAGSRLGIEMTF
jgi:non-lysosomal glucosylceramidase